MSGMRNDVWKNLGEEEAIRRINDLVIAKGYTEEEAFTEVYSIECGLDDDEEVGNMNELYIGRARIYFKSNSENAEEVYKQLQEICFQNDIEFYFDGEAILRNDDGEDIDVYEEV